MSAILCSAAMLHALADWDHVVPVISLQGIQGGNSGNGVHALNLPASDSSIIWLDVPVTFAKGENRTVGTGLSLQRRDSVADLPRSGVRDPWIDLTGHSMEFRDTNINTATDVEPDATKWRVKANSARDDSRMFDFWSDTVRYMPISGSDTSGWTTFGSISFEGRVSRESALGGLRNSSVTTIRLLPLNDDAVCDSVTATFSDGSTNRLPLINGNFLPENWITMLSIPSVHPSLALLGLNCHAEHGGYVTIEFRVPVEGNWFDHLRTEIDPLINLGDFVNLPGAGRRGGLSFGF